VLLYFSIRGIQWSEVWHLLALADLRYVVLALGLATVALFLRAVRWRILLRSRGPVDVLTAFWATAAGYFGNNFLPARAGELVRTMMVSGNAGLSKTFVLTTALSERLSDAIILVIISSVVLLTLHVRPGWFAHAAEPFAVIGLGGATAIAVLPKLEGLWIKLVGRVPIPQAFRARSVQMIEHVLSGIRAFHDSGRLVRFLLATLVIWFLDATGVVVGLHALGMSVSFAIAFLLITALALGSALPSTPGYVGIYQFVAVSVLTPFGFSRTNAIAYILLAQALQYAMTTFWGVWGLSRSRRLNFRAANAA
jgi:glycosyltransferase 2 family protein